MVPPVSSAQRRATTYSLGRTSLVIIYLPPAPTNVDSYGQEFPARSQGSHFIDGHARVINTSSSAVYHVPKGGIIWETLGMMLQGNVLFSNELARRYASQGIISSSLNPTLRHLNWFVVGLLGFFLHPASYGALTQLWSGTTLDGESHSGKFLIPWDRVGDAGPYSHDKELAERLWNWLEEQVKCH
ncbi:oxidoreductase family protein [Rhizoctonia solani]|uniref:Oxidoreductase family protein n=1 Tax=Rhizoctonia solani TaxID=456999 RepID=A0A8H8P8W9_9AGAM|nr:oxidoreductase family protein [Rhizoctonia solani]QRW27721.1 oxidoreductase family protein [Rhizoctonia solani]